MESKKYIVAIDLGEANVVVAVGSVSSNGLMCVDSIVSHPCEGIKFGMIENIAMVESALKGAISEVESTLNIKILEAYAGISGEFVRFACHSDHVYVSQPETGVNQADVNALFDRMRHVQAPDNERIMERIPQNYIVDETKEVKNPVGSYGRRLSSMFNFILCGKIPMQRLENALNRLNIRMINSLPNAISVAEAVLSPEEKEEGVVVVNIGAGLTDLTIYYRNVVRYIVSIPMGAAAINTDIRSMMIPDKYIEKLKCEFGSAVADLVSENKVVRVNGRTARESKNIVLYNLAVAIEARMAMLIDFVKREIAESGYAEKVPYGIVLTGGSAKLKNIDELCRRMTNMEVRIGLPIEGVTNESIAKCEDCGYATAVGILIRGAELGGCMTSSHQPLDPTTEVEPPKKVVVPPPPTHETETPPVKRPPITPSTTYTPPPPRVYTPPTPVVVEPPQKMVVEPPKPSRHTAPLSETVNHTTDDERVEEEEPRVKDTHTIDDDKEEFITTDLETTEGSENTPKKEKGFNITKILKGVFTSINKNFDEVGEEEI
ncbi:MAG: cell division protein FtsA [Rikenellaceae bacterium]